MGRYRKGDSEMERDRHSGVLHPGLAGKTGGDEIAAEGTAGTGKVHNSAGSGGRGYLALCPASLYAKASGVVLSVTVPMYHRHQNYYLPTPKFCFGQDLRNK